MSKEYIESKIPDALRVLQDRFPDGRIPKVYNGYIASLGAAVSQSGLKATLALFENRQAGTEKDRSCLTRIILDILDENHGLPDTGSRECPGGSLLRYVIEHSGEEERLKERIIDIAVAVKLALRTFELIEGGQSHGG